MRDIKTLLELVRKQVEECELENFLGMCGEIEVMAGHHEFEDVIDGCEIYLCEEKRLEDYLKANKPKLNKDGTECVNSDYWWIIRHKESRVIWLNKHIELN